jgi:HlyD family secretion protein
MPTGTSRHLHTIAVLGALAGAVGILLFLILGSGVTAPWSPGVVHATEVKIAPEISGRLARFAVAPGQGTRKGDDLAELVNPELSAALVLANAQVGEARVARDRVYPGVRVERVDMLERDVDTAKADLVFAEQFATWRAARVVGDHDLNTFLVRADPVPLQPGMTVWLEPMPQAGPQ